MWKLHINPTTLAALLISWMVMLHFHYSCSHTGRQCNGCLTNQIYFWCFLLMLGPVDKIGGTPEHCFFFLSIVLWAGEGKFQHGWWMETIYEMWFILCQINRVGKRSATDIAVPWWTLEVLIWAGVKPNAHYLCLFSDAVLLFAVAWEAHSEPAVPCISTYLLPWPPQYTHKHWLDCKDGADAAQRTHTHILQLTPLVTVGHEGMLVL